MQMHCCYVFCSFFPTSPALFKINFASAHGPLLWAILTWRNSLVFHDFDKVTSVFIHIFPPLVTFCIRWDIVDCQQTPDFCTINLIEVLGYPLLFYLFWQIAYYLKTEVVDSSKLAIDPQIQTSLRWLLKDKSFIGKLACTFGPNNRNLTFMGMQLLYTAVTMVPVYFMFYSHFVNTAFLVTFSLVSIWNGAQYYIEKFSQDYMKKYQ